LAPPTPLHAPAPETAAYRSAGLGRRAGEPTPDYRTHLAVVALAGTLLAQVGDAIITPSRPGPTTTTVVDDHRDLGTDLGRSAHERTPGQAAPWTDRAVPSPDCLGDTGDDSADTVERRSWIGVTRRVTSGGGSMTTRGPPPREDMSMQVPMDDAQQVHEHMTRRQRVGTKRPRGETSGSKRFPEHWSPLLPDSRRRALQASVFGLFMLVTLAVGVPPSVGAAAPAVPVWDDFGGGFTVGSIGSSAKWFYFATPDGAFVGDDGNTFTARGALTVVPKGTNPSTHLPAYSKTVAQEQISGLPGGLDHVKWLVYMNHLSSSGVPGFDAPLGQKLVCQATLGGFTSGTGGHPFGSAVVDPQDDLRLASFALNTIDFQTYMVFDVFYTNKRIYAFYEHLPFGRASMGGPYGEYAAFSYGIPILTRVPGDSHTVAVVYDRAAGVVSWMVDGEEKFRVSNLGFRIGRTNLLLDHGGTEQSFAPTQLDCGMGLFTLLDGHGAQDKGLVQLSTMPNFYYNPTAGAVRPHSTVTA
jgi:Family of unknown function (DUF6081)